MWIGIRGTYALREWGFEHPSATIFDTVADIIKQKYHETNNPVSFLVIQAEMGKYRKLVNRNSLVMASYFNSKLVSVDKDCFVPSSAVDNSAHARRGSEHEKLDEILKRFEIEIRGEEVKMAEPMSYERALRIANEALEAYQRAKTKAEVEEIFIKYGRNGIGYRPLCRIFFSKRPPEAAIQAYKKE